MARRCLSLLGTPDLWTRLGRLQSSTWNGMKWGVLTLLEISHSRGCYLKFAVLLVQRGCAHQNDQIPKDPWALCPRGLYSWWHFVSPANGSGSRDCAPVTWAYGAPCPAMVSPNAGLCKEDKLLYPDHHLIWCVESGFRPAHMPPHSDWLRLPTNHKWCIAKLHLHMNILPNTANHSFAVLQQSNLHNILIFPHQPI